jgi:Fe-S-cluster-containing dehydrogenase component
VARGGGTALSKLRFDVFSGGNVTIDLDTCLRCETKACVAECTLPNLGSVLVLRDGLPALGVTPERAAAGGCIECLACDLACQARGRGALTFSLPQPELEEYRRERGDDGDPR